LTQFGSGLRGGSFRTDTMSPVTADSRGSKTESLPEANGEAGGGFIPDVMRDVGDGIIGGLQQCECVSHAYVGKKVREAIREMTRRAANCRRSTRKS
jgi:hypothetical protein